MRRIALPVAAVLALGLLAPATATAVTLDTPAAGPGVQIVVDPVTYQACVRVTWPRPTHYRGAFTVVAAGTRGSADATIHDFDAPINGHDDSYPAGKGQACLASFASPVWSPRKAVAIVSVVLLAPDGNRRATVVCQTKAGRFLGCA